MDNWTLSALLLALAIPLGGSCPSHWTAYEGSCYKLFKERYTFFEAKDTCKIVGSDLVEMSGAGENDFVKHMATSASAHTLWMGLEDFVEEGTFVWSSSGLQSEFYNWQVGSPTAGLQSQDCGALVNTHGKWIDLNCETRLPFVCERQAYDETDGSGIIG